MVLLVIILGKIDKKYERNICKLENYIILSVINM